jgi:hypothetical protein
MPDRIIQGDYQAYVVTPQDIPALIGASKTGNDTARCLLQSVARWLSEKTMSTCMTCDYRLKGRHGKQTPWAFAILLEINNHGAVVAALCNRCVMNVGHENLLEHTVKHWQKELPDSEVLAVHPDVGHA